MKAPASGRFCLCCIVVAFIFLLTAPVVVFPQELEPAPTSRLTGVSLGSVAQRITDKDTLAQFGTQLQTLASRLQQTCVNTEVLAWAGPGYTRTQADSITQAVAAEMKRAGFVYDEQQAPDEQGSKLKILAARRQAQTITGFWITSDQVLMLAWCQLGQTESTPGSPTTPPLSPTNDKHALPASSNNPGSISPPAAAMPEQTSPDEVLAAGKPPLTQKMVSEFANFIEWLLDAPLTREQRDRLRSALKEDWTSGNAAEIQGDVDMLELDASLANKPSEEREYMRQQLRAQILREAGLKKDDKDLQWLSAIYEAAHQPIAPGNPPLTRQAADAYAELFGFMIAQVAGVSLIELDAAAKDDFAQGIAKNYAKLNPDEKKALAGMPAYWAGLRVAWSRASGVEREKLRAQWREQLRTILSPSQFLQLEGAKAFDQLSVWIEKAEKGEVKREELPQIAAAMEKVAKSLQVAGGEQNEAMAVRLNEMARQVTEASRAQAAPTRATTNSLKSTLNNNHSLYSSIMGRSMVSHYALMGAIGRIH